jgi:hypothetical protein
VHNVSCRDVKSCFFSQKVLHTIILPNLQCYICCRLDLRWSGSATMTRSQPGWHVMSQFPVYPISEVSLASQVMKVVAALAMCMGAVVETQDP